MAIKTNIYSKKTTPFDWQNKAENYKDLLIITPTDSGKTITAYNKFITGGWETMKKISLLLIVMFFLLGISIKSYGGGLELDEQERK
jgi:hypothetical protein